MSAVLYGLLVVLLPTALIAFDTPSSDELREQVVGALCERVPYAGCPAPESGGGTDGGTGTGSGGESTGGTGEGSGSGTTTGGSNGTSSNPGTGSTGGSSGGGQTVHLALRTPTRVAVAEDVTLPRASAPDVPVQPTAGGDAIPVPARSALALLIALDEESAAFAITDLVYYPAYHSFFLNCIEVAGEGKLCGSWQFAVNGSFPQVGLDTYLLASGDSLYLFSGTQRTIEAPSTAYVGEPFRVTVSAYDPERGAYLPTSGYTVGVLIPNPADPWSPTEVQTQEVGSDGGAMFTLTAIGDYEVGIKEDGYYPAAPLSVVQHRSGGGGERVSHEATTTPFDVGAARRFLLGAMGADGSFGAPLYTDWAAVALVASGASSSDLTRVRSYLLAHPATSTVATDYERRALALMALGVDPYASGGHNYVDDVRSFFGGVQLGDPALVNDDIFGLIVLERAGYPVGDRVVDHVLSFILSQQHTDGSWEGSVDLTAAAVQALAPYHADARGARALLRAEAYLRGAQRAGGGFGDGFATSWVLQAIAALEQDPVAWRSGGETPPDYLASLQERDGGVGPLSLASTTRLWATAYAIPAALGRPWRSFLALYTPTGEQGYGSMGAVSMTSTERVFPREAPKHVAVPRAAAPVRASAAHLEVAAATSSVASSSTAAKDELAAAVHAAPTQVVVVRVLAIVFTLLLAGFIGTAVVKRMRAL